MTLSLVLARVLQACLDANDDEAYVAIQALIDASQNVVQTWEHGDLSKAISVLADAVGA